MERIMRQMCINTIQFTIFTWPLGTFAITIVFTFSWKYPGHATLVFSIFGGRQGELRSIWKWWVNKQTVCKNFTGWEEGSLVLLSPFFICLYCVSLGHPVFKHWSQGFWSFWGIPCKCLFHHCSWQSKKQLSHLTDIIWIAKSTRLLLS